MVWKSLLHNHYIQHPFYMGWIPQAWGSRTDPRDDSCPHKFFLKKIIIVYIYIWPLFSTQKKIQMIKLNPKKIPNMIHHVQKKTKKNWALTKQNVKFLTLQISNIKFAVYCCTNKLLAIICYGLWDYETFLSFLF